MVNYKQKKRERNDTRKIIIIINKIALHPNKQTGRYMNTQNSLKNKQQTNHLMITLKLVKTNGRTAHKDDKGNILVIR